MVDIAAFIVHAPWVAERRANVITLLRQLKPAVDVAWVQEDKTKAGHWPTFRAGFVQALAKDPSHILVLEDDVSLRPGLAEGLRAVRDLRPDRAIGLFTMRQASAGAVRKRDTHWCETRKLANDQIMLYPANFVRDWLKFDRTLPDGLYNTTDVRRILFCAKHDLLCSYVLPTFGDHLMPSDSLLGWSNRNRVSPWIAENVAEVDWSKGVDQPYRDPYSVSYAGYLAISRLKNRNR